MPKKATQDLSAIEDNLQIRKRLLELGVMTQEKLKAEINASGGRNGDIVEDWFRPSSRNIIAGDSGIGKSPFLQQLGLCVAGNRPFLNRPVHPGRVLHLMFEGGSREDFCRSVDRMLKFLKLNTWPPDYFPWSPLWDDCAAPAHKTFKLIKEAAAAVVLIDPVRLIDPEAENKPQHATAFYRRLQALSPESCHVASHHVRKGSHETNPKNAAPDLRQETMRWLEQAAGTKSLITGADLRLGIEERPEHLPGDLLVAGFLRGSGLTGATILGRVYDEDGEPVAYEVLTGIGLLSERDRDVFNHLADHFAFKNAKAAFGGKSDSAAANFLRRCMGLDLLMKVGGQYLKNLKDE